MQEVLKSNIEHKVKNMPLENEECCICYEKANYQTNCMHNVCFKCLLKISKCPMCRSDLNIDDDYEYCDDYYYEEEDNDREDFIFRSYESSSYHHSDSDDSDGDDDSLFNSVDIEALKLDYHEFHGSFERSNMRSNKIGEIYKPIPNYDNYEISNYGNVRKKSTGYILKYTTLENFYMDRYVNLYKNGIKNRYAVWYLHFMARTFGVMFK
jgi:hypothetical protein